jgi:methylmalonyl-CoA mutase
MSWLTQLEKDLKGKPLSALDWTIEPGLELKPFYVRGDLPEPALPLLNVPEGGNAWRICERLGAADAGLANARALEALSNGADMLWFDLPKGADAAFLGQLLKDIHLSYIFTVFRSEDALSCRALLPEQPEPFQAVFLESGSVRAGWSDQRPGMHLDGLHRAGLPPGEQLAALMEEAAAALEQWRAEGRGPEFSSSCWVSLPVGDHYLLEIGKLRAFKLLWLRWMESLGWPAQLPHLHVETANAHADVHTNMIAAATQALSAAVAGAHSLRVCPANNGDDGFHRRIARNVQHLLQLESGVDRVADPAAGSYFLEKLTHALADRVGPARHA